MQQDPMQRSHLVGGAWRATEGPEIIIVLPSSSFIPKKRKKHTHEALEIPHTTSLTLKFRAGKPGLSAQMAAPNPLWGTK